MSANNEMLIGKVIGTHGIKGQLRVLPFSGESDTMLALNSVILKGPRGERDVFPVTATGGHGKKVILTLGGFSNINEVLHLVGRELYVNREQLPELPPGEYYWCDLFGLEVRTVGGEILGTIADILAAGNNDVYVVREGVKEYLIPAVEAIVLQVNLDERVMIIDPPEGLLDL